MKSKQILAAGLLSLTLITSAAPMSVSAKAKANYSIKKTGGNSRLLVSEQAVVPQAELQMKARSLYMYKQRRIKHE